MTLAISILGITGKMGRSLLEAALRDPDVTIVSGTARSQVHAFKSTIPILSVEQALARCEIAIDFSVQEAALQHLFAAKEAKKTLVIGTTGLKPDAQEAIQAAARDIPIFLSANFSTGMALCLEMAALLSDTLFDQGFIDIFETHHVHKKDCPSGTALALAQAIGKGKIVHAISEPRSKDEIAIHSTRTGETMGEHLLIFENDHERIEIKHTAHSRLTFAHGALRAAKWLVGKPSGLYTMKDLLYNRPYDS